MKKKVLTFLLVMTVLITSVNILPADVYAADGTVKIFLGDGTTARHHKAIAEGSMSEELSFTIREGTVKKSSYSSDNPNSFQIVEQEGKTYISGIKEGVGYVTLNVETTTGEKYKERLFISVYKGFGTYTGVINANADVYRGACVKADVENLDDKGDFAKNTKVDVVATCADFYLIRTIDGTIFADDKDTGFVEKKYINVLAESLDVSEEYVSIEKNKSTKINATVQPTFAKDKSVSWSSDDNKIVTVDKEGNIKGVKEGNATITVKTNDGSNKSKAINVSVYTKYSEEYSGYFKVSSAVYKTASNNKKAIETELKSAVSILGECGKYFFVKCNNTYGFAPKADIYVYVKKIEINRKNITLAAMSDCELRCQIFPKFASNKKIDWSSSEDKYVTVDQDGKVNVTFRAKGNIIIEAKASENHAIRATCQVKILDIKAAKLKVKQKAFNKKSVVLTWTKQTNAKKYVIYRNDKKIAVVVNKRKWTDKKLKRNKEYKYYVAGFTLTDVDEKSMPSNTVEITVKSPQKKKANKKDKLTWNKIYKASKYVVYQYNKKKKKYIKVGSTKKKIIYSKKC